MAYKLIALDLDDTLLDCEKHISKRNREALAAARKARILSSRPAELMPA